MMKCNSFRKYLFVLPVCLFLSQALLFGQSRKEISKVVNAFGQAMKARDMEGMEALIAKDFTIGIYDGEKKDYLLEGILKAYPEIASVHFQGKKKKGGLVLAQVQVIQKDGKEDSGNIAIDANGKIRYSDLFDRLYGLDRYSDNGLIATLPFEMVNGKMLIKAKLNDSEQVLDLVFDTGADGMALSPYAAEKVGIKNTRDHETAVVGGKTKVKFSSGNTVHLTEDLSLDKQNLVIFPGMERREDGIIGGGILRRFTTRLDFDKGVIELYDYNSFEPSSEAQELTLDFDTGVPEISINYFLANVGEEKAAQMVFDTGAGYSMIFFGPYVGKEDLMDGFKADYHSTNYSMGMATPIQIGNLQTLKVGNLAVDNVMVSLQAFDPQRPDWVSSAGSFGLELIQKFNVAIDVLNRKLYLEPNTLFVKPVDFYLAGMILHFDEENSLKVKQVAQGSDADRQGIRAGQQLMMVNDMTAEELLDKVKLLELKSQAGEAVLIRYLTGDEIRQVELSN